MSLSELAESVGESVETVTFYERLGLIEAAFESSPRRYDEGARLRLQIIRKGKRLGFSLREIGLLIEARTAGREPSKIPPPADQTDRDDAGRE